MAQIILPNSVIGILGGGQLGRMMAIAAKEMGYRIAVLENTDYCPAQYVADFYFKTTDYTDKKALDEFAHICDVITYEFENIPIATIEYLQNNCKAYIPQGSTPLKISQHRLIEKTTIQENGGQVTKFLPISTMQDIEKASAELGYPFIVKTCMQGYDGKGQVLIKHQADLQQAEALVKEQKCIAEAFVHFEKEISVIVVRNTQNEIITLPIAENEHRNGILHKTIVPAHISDQTTELATQTAINFMIQMDLVGTLAIEFFVVGSKVLFNELAPRPHNSGHFSIEAVSYSQFQQHIRAICGLPLGNSELLVPAAGMVNILGQHTEKAKRYFATHHTHNTYCHLYGKREEKHNRKMGHITILGKHRNLVVQEIDKIFNCL
ncbi:MAG: 5-(carboxyamino)imidazole ribonucleotide synthase [Phycisphaerales bacterium]|nr:5-(carboxyamino)imidazole ribonucleotide synthase [Phycisphaerales bacterium]